MKITWDEFDNASGSIAWHYQGLGITKIVGLQRGGLPLSVKLSNEMGIPMGVLNYQTRDGLANTEDMRSQILEFGDLSNVLFVDDICDSGRTIKDIQHLYPNARFAVLTSRRRDLVEFCPIEIPEGMDGWVTFPWG